MPTWEQRWHPLREEWVIVAAHRQNRPCLSRCRRDAVRGGRQRHLLKYLAGPEIGGGNFLSDASPEASAAELRALPAAHHAAPAATPTPTR